MLDFGLAKEVRAVDPGDGTYTSAAQTQAGVVMGTPAYMSPEQVAGRAVDHRTDIFSFGILLYEMATGQRPFAGDSSAELASAILRDTPRSSSEVRADVPAGLARIIRRCLEKDVRHRLQTARDIGKRIPGPRTAALAPDAGGGPTPSGRTSARLRPGAPGRGFLGRGAPIQAARRERRSDGTGRGAVRGDRDRAVAVFLPARDRAPRRRRAIPERPPTCEPSARSSAFATSWRAACDRRGPRSVWPCSSWTPPPAPTCGRRLTTVRSARMKSSRCRTTSCRGSSPRWPT